MTSIRVRLNARLDALPGEAGEPVVLLLVAADETSATVRSPRAFRVGDVLHLTGATTCQDHHAFPFVVTNAVHRLAPDEGLDFHELHGTITDLPAYHAFLGGLARAYRDLREDLRFLLPLPARVHAGGHWIDTHADNVSFGGAFLVLDEPSRWHSGEPLAFSLTFPSGVRVTAEGLVVYTITPEKARQLGGPAGVGVCLTLSAEAREAWRSAVETLRAHLQTVLHIAR